MSNKNEALRKKVVDLRRLGKTYSEIKSDVGLPIPKSTLSCWCRDIPMPVQAQKRIARLSQENLARGRAISLQTRVEARKEKERLVHKKNTGLYTLFRNDLNARKIALVMLYVAEGSKSDRGSLMFGNSSPDMIRLFLVLLRDVYEIDENKFRATVQCRADQDINTLQKFWSKVTKIPIRQFYKAQVDQRTANKPTRKPDYKGVCRIDYFSSNVDLELKWLAKTMERM